MSTRGAERLAIAGSCYHPREEKGGDSIAGAEVTQWELELWWRQSQGWRAWEEISLETSLFLPSYLPSIGHTHLWCNLYWKLKGPTPVIWNKAGEVKHGLRPTGQGPVKWTFRRRLEVLVADQKIGRGKVDVSGTESRHRVCRGRCIGWGQQASHSFKWDEIYALEQRWANIFVT